MARQFFFFSVLLSLLGNVMLYEEVLVERFDPFMLGSAVIEDFLTTIPPLQVGPRRPTRRTTSTTTLFPPTTMYPHWLVEPTNSVCNHLDPPGYDDTWTSGNLRRKLFGVELRWMEFGENLLILVSAARIKGLFKGALVQVRENGKPVGTLSTRYNKNATIFSCSPGYNNTIYAASTTRIHFIILSAYWSAPPDFSTESNYTAHVTFIKKPEVYLKTETVVPKHHNPYLESVESLYQRLPTDSYDWGIIKMTTAKKRTYTKEPDYLSQYKFWEKQRKQHSYMYYI